MHTKEYQQQKQMIVASGWMVLLVLKLVLLVSQLLHAAIVNDFSPLATQPGPQGLIGISVMLCVHAQMSVLTRLIGRTWFRWVNVALLALVTLFIIVHQQQSAGESPAATIISVVHHVIGVIVTMQAVLWARSAGAERAAAGALRSNKV
jgi:hypothetical protein